MYENLGRTKSPSNRGGYGGDSAYNTHGAGYNTNYSAVSMDPREERSRKNWRLIAQAKEVIRMEREREEKMELRQISKQGSKDGKNTTKRRYNEAQKLEDDARRAYLDRQSKLNRIGSFKFDIDNELDVEILTSD